MLVRDYNNEDIECILKLGSLLHSNYELSLNEFSKCLVIEDNGVLIGFVIYSVIYERAEIIDIIIDPTNRLKGYGIFLLNYVIDEIKRQNCENITLEVNSSNEGAINLYKKLGFKIEAVRKNYYNDNDGYLMKKDLR